MRKSVAAEGEAAAAHRIASGFLHRLRASARRVLDPTGSWRRIVAAKGEVVAAARLAAGLIQEVPPGRASSRAANRR